MVMITRSKLTLALASAVFLAAQPAAAAVPDAKVWNGTWHLDAAKSKFGAVGTEQSETRTYNYSGGKLTVKSSSKNAAGKELNFSYSAAFDGKSYPMTGNPNADSISLNAVSGREVKATSRMHGKVTVQSTASVSADGKHLTLKRTYLAIKGAPTEVLLFDR
jgi:opacity protein-like surface antigen